MIYKQINNSRLIFLVIGIITIFVFVNGCKVQQPQKTIIHSGFRDFSRGTFGSGGYNLYVNANGIIETINRLDVNNDGYVDLVLANSHDYIERGPTHIYSMTNKENWDRQQLPNDSGWMSRIVDLDKDGFVDLIVANGENGVSSELQSYVYWGSSEGVSADSKRTELSTMGAYDVAVLDINNDGQMDLIFPSAWRDHHNPGKPLLVRVFLSDGNRQFIDATEKYGITGIASVSIAEKDLNKDGFTDLVLANYRVEHDYNTESFIYWGKKEGIDTQNPVHLPTFSPLLVITADVDQDSWDDVVFSGGNQFRIYWNKKGKFNATNSRTIEVSGYSSLFSKGKIGCEVADLNGDGQNEFILATKEGVQIRSCNEIEKVQKLLPLTNSHWVTTHDIDNDGRKDLVVSRYDDGKLYDCKSAVYFNSDSGFSVDNVSWFDTAGAVGNTAGDIDGDGRAEIIFNNTMSGHRFGIYNYIYLGSKDGNYHVDRRIELPTDNSEGECVIADLDMDGYPEVIFHEVTPLNDFISIYYGGPNGPKPDECAKIPCNEYLFGIRIADFNKDGFLDILGSCGIYDDKPESLAKSGFIYYGSKNGFSQSNSEVIKSYSRSTVFHSDINKDGYLDILFDEQNDNVLIYMGSKDGYSKNNTKKVLTAKSGAINAADLNGDDWLDLIMSIGGHYTRIQDVLHIYYGSCDGYNVENSQKLMGGYSPIHTSVADYNRDGNLDIFVSAYSSPTARVLPSKVFWGNGKTIDLNNPVNLMTEASSGALSVDLNRDGWIDLFVPCHRNDIGHKVDSLILWNGPEGFSTDRATRLPGLGPHATRLPDHGNVYTREPEEYYISPPFDIKSSTVNRIHWQAEVLPPSQLKFQIRTASKKHDLEKATWTGPDGDNTYYKNSGDQVKLLNTSQWLQYRAVFVSPYGCRSPKLKEVRIDLKQRS